MLIPHNPALRVKPYFPGFPIQDFIDFLDLQPQKDLYGGSQHLDSGETQGIPNPVAKRLYTLKEASIYLGRPVFSVRTLIWNGALPVIRDGRKIYLDVCDMDSYIEKNKLTVI